MSSMLAAIATFILLYTALTSLRGPLTDSSHILSRSLNSAHASVRSSPSVPCRSSPSKPA